MQRKRVLQILTAVGGGLVAVAALFVALFVLKSGGTLSRSTVATPYGWLIPLSAGLVIFGVAWALSSQPRHVNEPVRGRASVPCETCGKLVMGEWRLCPYCGNRLGTDVSESKGQPQSTTV